MKPTLHLLCGLPGSGKTTLAKQLAQQTGALRFAPDAWMIQLALNGHDEEQRAAIESLQWDLAQEFLRRGHDVILEFGFWSRRERECFRNEAIQLGAHCKLHYLDAPREVLIERISRRNESPTPDSFFVDPAQLDHWITLFEPPTKDELQ